MIKVSVNNVIASATDLKLLTQGMVNGRQVEFSFTPDWEGLTKTAVFTNGIETRKVGEYKWEGNVVYIPPEVLSVPNCTVKCGVYGINSSGEKVIPTLWTNIGKVFPAASPSEFEESVPPTPNVWDDLQKQIGNLNNLNTKQRDNLVEALNEVLSSYGVDPKAIESAVQSYLEKNPVAGITQETDPTVPEWAKQPTKPSYTADEVGALSKDTPIPSIAGLATEQFVNDAVANIKHPAPDLTGYATEQYVDDAIANIDIPTGGGGGNSSIFTETVEFKEDVNIFRIQLPCVINKLVMWNMVLITPAYEGNPSCNLYVNLGGNANIPSILPNVSICLTGVKLGEDMRIYYSGRNDVYYGNLNPIGSSAAVAGASKTNSYIQLSANNTNFIFPTGTKYMFWGVYEQ